MKSSQHFHIFRPICKQDDITVHENLWRESEFRENRPSGSPTLLKESDQFL